MTTNQTIDGVPRELLERIMHGCMFSLSRQQHEELRALLDAPACSACTACLEKPAASPRGEPVCYLVNDRFGGKAYLEEGSEALAVRRRLGFTDEIPLYAEHPAPVAVVMSFDFEHPSSKERRTVALSKQDVFDGMEDYFYDKIGEQICRCESVGETNVVDCSCDEYVHDFEIVKASLTS